MFPGSSKFYLVRIMCETCQSYAVQHKNSDAQKISSHQCEKVLLPTTPESHSMLQLIQLVRLLKIPPVRFSKRIIVINSQSQLLTK